MWTNVFRIGGLHHISWFQFLPHESDITPLDKSVRAEQRDAATSQVLSSHLQLQNEGFLSTWTNSFVGPWDPSQGLHNPDEKIKLWLFLPGCHSSVIESAQAAISRLRIVASGQWMAPGDSEEVATALSQALRNRIERALIGLSYVRFGDVFARYCPISQSEQLFRKGWPTIEFVFAATEDSIFVHVIVTAKLIRALSDGDMERVLKLSSNGCGGKLPVIVSPHGMRGRLTGCCPSDLVKQVYIRSGNLSTSTGLVGLSYPLSQASGCKLRGQSCYAEVMLGYATSGSEKEKQSNFIAKGNFPNSVAGDVKKGCADDTPVCEKTFIYPREAVIVPVLQTSYAKSSLKRFWLQNWMGPSLASSTIFTHCCPSELDAMGGSCTEPTGIRSQHGDNSSSNSNNSSISSINSSSSESDSKVKTTASELEADADSISCRQSGLSSVDPIQRNGSKQGAKRPRTGMEESFGQVGTSIQDAYKSDFNNPTITGLANDQMGSLWPWDWDDDDSGVGMDIQALLSEFGGFGDFFENDALPFGEPPGTAESQALIFSGPEFGDVAGTTSGGIMEVSDQMPLPVTFPAFEIFNPTPTGMEECVSAVQEATKSTSSSAPGSYILAASAVEFDQVTKAEALMTFASEYGAVETPSSEVSSTIFRSPYLPISRKVPSNSSGTSYVYGVTPPSSPHLVASDEKPGMSVDSSLCSVKGDVGVIVQSKKFYTHVESGKEPLDRKSVRCNNSAASCEGTAPSFSGFNPTNAVKSVQNKTTEVTFHAEDLLLSRKTIPAAELDCLIFQASMCRIRHTLLSSGNPASITWIRSAGSTVLSQLPGDPSNMTDNVHSKYEVKKKDSIPVRIAGDIDRRMLDGPLSAPVGVWRSVGEPKCAKPVNTPATEVFPSSSHNEENTILYGQRQPLQDLLDGLPLLVQQAASFVDVALDTESTDGPYGWLALQEQWRRGFCCGPHLVHAGCGGTLASGHSLDIAGVELVDPLSADVHASSVIGFLQSDMKTALKSAFSTLDGPLPVMDWCKGCCQSGDAGAVGDGFSAESSLSECTTTPSMGDPASPLQSSAGVASSIKDGAKGDDSQRRLSQEFCVAETEQQLGFQRRPSVFVVPYPSVLVGYQDDWLKTSPSSIQLWEKAPFEPYALPKHMIYSVVCPNIEPLISAARDFFQQLGTVYETCKLGAHSPQSLENQMEVDSGKFPSSGFVLLDCPQAMKIETTQASLVGSISDYFLSLSNGWDMNSFLKSLKKVLKALKFGSPSSMHTKEGNNSPSTVIYVVCPFPDPCAILQTLIESSVTVGSVIFSADSDRRSMLHNQVCKALSYSAGVDEASASNILALSGFNIPKLVLQVITVDAIFRVTSPTLSEPVLLKDIAFTVYNKARRVSRGFCNDVVQSGRSHPVMMQMPNSIPGMWKECVAPRISCASVPRESDIDSGLRAGTWDSTWQTSRSGTLICDPNRGGDFQEEVHYMFEPLFILAEPGSMEHGVSPTFTGNGGMESTRQLSDDSSTGSFIQSCASAVSGDTGPGSQLEGPETDGCGSGLRKSPPTLHCCYGWTEDWHWLVCIWTDSRGELLDSNIFPFGGTSSRQDTKGMQSLFVQVLQQGCQILQACSSPDTFARARDFVITRIGCFYELECQEWQKALYSIGGSEVKKWPIQLRRAVPVGISTSSNGPSLQQQEMERSLPSSPSPLYSPPAKSSGFMKAGLGQPTSRKQLGGPAVADGSRGLLQWVQSISFVAISIDHTLQLVLQADSSPGGTQVGVMGASSSYLEGYTPVRSLGSVSASYILIPSPSMRFLSPTPLQLPLCLTAESPPLAHLLHSRGSAIPLATGFVVSKAVPSLKKDASRKVKEEWPSVLSVSLIDYYGGYASNEKLVKGISKHGGRASISEARDYEIDTHLILESIAAELHALSWMTVSPAYLERRTALPFHCDMVLRLRRLLHFAEKQISPERK